VSHPEITLILPAFNEAATIRATIAEIVGYFEARGSVYEIIVAADGQDGTREISGELAQANPAIHVIGQKERRGKGRGIREAVAIARGEYVGYADADNKVPIQEYGKVEPWLRQGYEAVIGSRTLQKSLVERSQPVYRRIGSSAFNAFVRSFIGLDGITDTQCGFKFFARPAAVELFRRQRIDGYMFDVEILALARRLGYRVKQVPVRWRDDGDSRLELVRGNLRNVIDILKIRLTQERL